MNLKGKRELAASPVVANCRMNRERELSGGNSYTRDLCLNPVEFLTSRLEDQQSVCWLDLCCGRGRALITAARQFAESGTEVKITGVDLVGMFDAVDVPNLTLVESAVEDWEPAHSYDLITCVHGLHYVGDKIGAVSRAVSWLTETGRFRAHLDSQNLRHLQYQGFGRVIVRHLRESGLEFDARRKIIGCAQKCHVSVPWIYLGADDEAGPNFTGQSAVNSWYAD